MLGDFGVRVIFLTGSRFLVVVTKVVDKDKHIVTVRRSKGLGSYYPRVTEVRDFAQSIHQYTPK